MKTLHIALGSMLLTSIMACGPSLGSMHEGAMAGQVQEHAPLHARQSIHIDAPRDRVFAVLTDFAGWTRWQPGVTEMTPPASLAPGQRFIWVTGGQEIHSQLAAVSPGMLVAWTGSVSTAKAAHVYRLSSPTPETTLVEDEETMDGFLLTWFYGQKDLDKDMAQSLAHLKSAAEPAVRRVSLERGPGPL